MTETINEPLRLRDALEQVTYARSHDETRTNLTGIFLERDGEDMLATATDGHRLAQTRVPDYPLPLPPGGLLLSVTQIQALRKVLHKKQRYCAPMEVELGHGTFPMEFRAGDVDFLHLHVRGQALTLPNTGDFPHYRAVIPTSRTVEWTENLGPKWKDMAEAADILGDASENGMVKLELTRRDMILRTERKFKSGQVTGMASVELYSHEEIGDRAVLVNARYLAGALRHVANGILLVKSPDDLIPIVLQGPLDLAVVMPVRC